MVICLSAWLRMRMMVWYGPGSTKAGGDAGFRIRFNSEGIDTRMQFSTHYDSVIVGAGHNGLVAASYLARAGQSVLVLERNDDLGGATSSKAIFPGMEARLSRYSYLVSLLPASIIADLGLRFSTRQRRIASCTPFERAGAPEALVLSNVDEARSRAAGPSLARTAGRLDLPVVELDF